MAIMTMDDIKMRKDGMKLRQFAKAENHIIEALKNDKELHDIILPQNESIDDIFPELFMNPYKDFISCHTIMVKKCETQAETGNLSCEDLLQKWLDYALAAGDYSNIGEPVGTPFQM